MPSVDVAMRRSLGRGFLDLFVASMRPVLQKREGTITRVANEAADVKLAFSSWDNCMQANFCK